MECVRCGATAMLEGALMEGSSGADVLFCAKEVSYLKRIFAVGNRKVLAYACLHCSHLELVVQFNDKDRARYQEFEGPQPDVIERIK